jgi:CheY-like chemotaxis protein
MDPLRILIVEDDAQSLHELEAATRGCRPEVEITSAGAFDQAMELGEQVEFDLIFTDLLLLPEGVEMRNSRLVSTETGKILGPEAHQRFLNTEGGIGFVRSLRTKYGPNTYKPIVVMTWYMEGDGYEAIEEELMLDDDPKLVMLPKYSRIAEVTRDLDPESRSKCPPLEQPLQRLLDQCLSVPWDHEHGEKVRRAAKDLTKKYRITKAETQDAPARFPQQAGPMHYAMTGSAMCTLNIDIDPLGDSETIVKLLGGTKAGADELSNLRDWPLLRDWVLLNPRIEVELSITVRLVSEEEDLPPVDLPVFRTSPDKAYETGPTGEAMLVERLIERLLLVFIAHHSQPPTDRADDGLGITNNMICRNLATGRTGDGVQTPGGGWGATGVEPDLEATLARLTRGARIQDKVQDLRATLREAMPRYQTIGGDALNLIPEASGKRGSSWYFNGNMALHLPTEEWHQPHGAEAQKVAFFVLSDQMAFQCLGGRYAPSDELEQRFRHAGMTVERFTSLDEIVDLRDRLPEATLAVVAPVDDAQLDQFVSGPARQMWLDVGPQGRPPTILVLTDEAVLRSPEEMEKLRAAGIDCMYPSRIEGALDLTKIIDHVICAGYRTRYGSEQAGEDALEARVAARPKLKKAFSRLVDGFAYDGDLFSGAASERIDGGRIAITASKTNKLSDDPDDVAVIDDFDVMRNIVTWRGRKRPSSSSRWHALIYDRILWASCILHTHWKSLTYNDAMEDRATSRYRLSGSRREAAEITGVLSAGGPPAAAAVLRDHGEVFIGEDWDSIVALVERTMEANYVAR